MNYALTIRDNLITGVHESAVEFTPKTFENNPRLSADEVRLIPARADYLTGVDIRCFEVNGTAKDPVWCIEQGYMALPEGWEIIDGVLVQSQVPEAEASPTLLKRVERAEQANAVEASAARVVFIALAQAGTVTPVQALEHQVLFPHWAESIGKQAAAGEYYQHDGLYRVKQAHILSAEWPPGVATAALFERIQPEGEIEDWQPGQSYAQGVHVMHSGFEWESMVANNIWEPGGAGVYENIWKKVIG